VVSRKTAIWPRVTEPVGQKFPLPQPAVIPRRATSLIQGACGSLQGTSAKTGVVQAGGM
jgi:hypothetical protein